MLVREEKIIKLFANCMLVSGAKRSIICDVFRGRYQPIPNALYLILKKYPNSSITEIKNMFGNERNDIIDEYFDFLINEEYGFLISKKEIKAFPNMDLSYDSPSTITNCIIDIDKNSSHDFRKISNELSLLNTYHIQLRFFFEIMFDDITQILEKMSNAEYNLHIILPYHPTYTKRQIEKLSTIGIVSSIKFYNASMEIIKEHEELNKFNIEFFETKILNEKCCGKIGLPYFNINIELFTESQHHNSCLNRKISIDRFGNIKNCPSMKASYGTILNSSLRAVLNKKEYKEYWNIRKDEIKVCQDCEFRYICTDCRAYTEDPSDPYSKPLKCGYDPYSGQWEEWSKNPLKTEIIKHYEL